VALAEGAAVARCPFGFSPAESRGCAPGGAALPRRLHSPGFWPTRAVLAQKYAALAAVLGAFGIAGAMPPGADTGVRPCESRPDDQLLQVEIDVVEQTGAELPRVGGEAALAERAMPPEQGLAGGIAPRPPSRRAGGTEACSREKAIINLG
jgi:hypothetical protein